MKKMVLCLFSGIFLVSCGNTVSNTVKDNNETPQDDLCIITKIPDAGSTCKVGQLMYFEPERWGNEQLPMTFIAVACDTNKPIYYNNGGVVCTFTYRKIINGKPVGNKSESSTDSN